MIYLDHAAAAPISPFAVQAMAEAARDSWGNPRSAHAAGRRALAALDRARAQVGTFLGAPAREILFMPSGRAALAWAIDAAVSVAPSSGELVSSRLEHPAVVDALEAHARRGRGVRWLSLPRGAPSGAPPSGAAVAVFAALSAELGTTLPLADWMAAAPAVRFVVDAVQAAAWRDDSELCHGGALVVCSSAKVGGPPGVAAVRVPPEIATRFDVEERSAPWLAAVGFGAACAARGPTRGEALERARELSRRLLDGLRAHVPDLALNAGPTWLGPIVSVSIPGRSGRQLAAALDLEGVAVSRGAACRGALELPEAVRAAFPDEPWRAESAVRFSLGPETTREDIDAAVDAVARVLPHVTTTAPPPPTTPAPPVSHAH